jgi:hypothetical protein
MRRDFILIASRVVSIMILFSSSVMSTTVLALSHEEWVLAFARFVDWPTPAPEKTLVVCQPPDTPTLALQGQQLRGLTVEVTRIRLPRELDRCHVFVALAQREKDWSPWLAILKQRPVLPVLFVGTGERYCEQGGSVCLVQDAASKSEKYQLNLDSIARAGFKVRSQLLRPSRAPAKSTGVQ